jgi:SAM-dependent methyltransferase
MREAPGHPQAVAREIETQKRSCPVCSRADSQLLFRQSFRSLDRIGLLNGYDIVVCKNCGMTFADDIPTQAAFDEYYRGLSKYAYEHRSGQESPEDSWRLQQVANTIRSFVPNLNSRILEVGCATGRLLGYLKEFGYTNIFGLDPAPDCAELARRLHGVEVITGSIFDGKVEAGSYDFVISLQVLEHIRDLDQALAAFKRLLSKDGLFYVDVPDATHYVPEREAPYQEFSTEHINFFSPASLRHLMEGTGFRTMTSQSAELKDRSGKPIPIAFGVFQNGGERKKEFSRNSDAEAGIRRYVAACRQMDDALRGRINEALANCPSIIVWGVGTHTQRLLATGALNPGNIAAFIDSNPKYQNQALQGIPVLRPDALHQRTEPILISSFGFQNEIARQIRDMNISNELILLYPQPTAA